MTKHPHTFLVALWPVTIPITMAFLALTFSIYWWLKVGTWLAHRTGIVFDYVASLPTP